MDEGQHDGDDTASAIGPPATMADAGHLPRPRALSTHGPPKRSEALVYRFGRHCFDTVTGRLERSGQIVGLRPRAAALLADLLVRRNRCVARRELASRLWPGCAATGSSFSTLIAELRRAVDDDGRRQRVIRTLGGRGYRFVARVETGPVVDLVEGVREQSGAATSASTGGQRSDAHQIAADSLELARAAGPRHLEVQSSRPDAFVDEWARTASELGFDVHRTHCGHDASPPLWAWWQLSASVIESLEASVSAAGPTHDHIDRTRAVWRRIQIELEDSARRGSPRDGSVAVGERQRRFALCHDLARALLRTAAHAPCALVLEHMGPADDDNARLLRFVLMHVSPPTPLWVLSSRVVPANLCLDSSPLSFPRTERIFPTAARTGGAEAGLGDSAGR